MAFPQGKKAAPFVKGGGRKVCARVGCSKTASAGSKFCAMHKAM